MKTLWMFICILIISLVTAMFAVVNTSPVLVHLVAVDTELPLIVIILSSTLLGGMIVGLIGLIKQFKLKRAIKQLERQLNDLKREQADAAPAIIVPAGSTVESASIQHFSEQPISPNNLP
jgi:putative membrane protein